MFIEPREATTISYYNILVVLDKYCLDYFLFSLICYYVMMSDDDDEFTVILNKTVLGLLSIAVGRCTKRKVRRCEWVRRIGSEGGGAGRHRWRRNLVGDGR